MQKYQILGIIGQGAYGVVLRCRNTETKQIVAIKKFKQSQDDEIVKKTTMRQVKVLRMMNQQNIVELKQAFRKKGIVCLVFQYVHHNLLQVLQKSPSGLDPELIRIYMYQLLKGLAYLHSVNIIHRDIKPQNLLVSEKKILKICDFGFAKLLKKNQQNQELTDYVATRWYRPPQLLVGARYGKQIDIWGVGCIFGQLIDGMPMFPGQNQIDQLFLIQKCLGPLTADQRQIFLKNQRFLGMKFPEINTLDTLEKRYLGKLTPKALNFLKSLLKMDPKDRFTSIEALRHPYFDGMREQQYIKKLISSEQYKPEQRVISANSHQQQGMIINSIKVQHTKMQPEKNETIYPVKNGRIQIKRKEEISRQTKIQNFNKEIGSRDNNNATPQLYSKSVNKNGNKKIKQKTISVQKHHNKQLLTKTQGGFYIQIAQNNHQTEKNAQQDSITYGKNKIYGLPTENKQQTIKLSGKGLTTQQVVEQQKNQLAHQSTGQLPVIMIGKKQSRQINQYLKQKQKNNINIIINNNTYNYKTNNNYKGN